MAGRMVVRYEVSVKRLTLSILKQWIFQLALDQPFEVF